MWMAVGLCHLWRCLRSMLPLRATLRTIVCAATKVCVGVCGRALAGDHVDIYSQCCHMKLCWCQGALLLFGAKLMCMCSVLLPEAVLMSVIHAVGLY